jgi:hypothetical protein
VSPHGPHGSLPCRVRAACERLTSSTARLRNRITVPYSVLHGYGCQPYPSYRVLLLLPRPSVPCRGKFDVLCPHRIHFVICQYMPVTSPHPTRPLNGTVVEKTAVLPWDRPTRPSTAILEGPALFWAKTMESQGPAMLSFRIFQILMTKLTASSCLCFCLDLSPYYTPIESSANPHVCRIIT